ncbi:MAG TPA: orotidine-5'-phosphate decarboxylase [Myxococcaceae bacterium]|nr:orotidine-5'-phosphate decarboxylase [Myxococcaceae bacterium]
MTAPARDHLAWAADVRLGEARALYRRLRPFVSVVKVGLSLFVEEGPRAVEMLRAEQARIFLDLKLHDIPNTVELAAARAAGLGVAYLTVHAAGGPAMLAAALRGAKGGAAAAGLEPPRVLAVTALTSLDDAAVTGLGFGASAAEMAERLASVAAAAGVGGLVCSAREVAELRRRHPDLFLCTPGIRPPGADAADQARTETAEAAIRSGANLLVVGRPLHGAADPVAAARSLHEAVAAALGERAG